MRHLLTTIVLIASSAFCFSQVKSNTISGSVDDPNARPLESVTVSLLKLSDSSVIKYTVSDKTGKFSFEKIPGGKYIISFSAVGHVASFSKAVEVSDINDQIILKPV